MDKIRFDDIRLYFDLSRALMLGKGAFGTVLRMICINPLKDIDDTYLEVGQYYAIKKIRKDTKFEGSVIDNLVNEIEILKAIRHPYCVKLYDVFQSETEVYLVMEYVKGEELFQLIAENRLNDDESLKIINQTMEALGYLHMRKIVHRDLKPENIMITDTNEVKLVDFGFARFMGNEEIASFINDFESSDNFVRTMSNNEQQEASDVLIEVNNAGSLQYLAPEAIDHIMRNGINVTRKITCEEAQKGDSYSMGVIIYALFCKRYPFRGHSSELILKNMEKGVEFPNSFCSKAPKYVEICRSLLEIDHKRRSSVGEFMNLCQN